MGWTGGQYSLYRAALAAAVGGRLLAVALGVAGAGTGALPGAAPILGLLVVAPLLAALAAGTRDRGAALLLAPIVVLAELAARLAVPADGATALAAAPGSLAEAVFAAASGRTALLPALLLLLHARVPTAPFGSLAARTRIDPRGGWQRPAVQTEIGWALLTVALAAALVEAIGDGTSARAGLGTSAGSIEPSALGLHGLGAALAAGFALAVALFGWIARPARPTAWSVLALFGLACLAASGTGAALRRAASTGRCC
ncbi:MAG: hypothetical protein U0900_23170 [Myxococcota bacterium]